MPLELGRNNRPHIHPRRLTNVGEILKGAKNSPGKRKGAKRPKPMNTRRSPLSKIAWSLHERRKQQYLMDLNRQAPES